MINISFRECISFTVELVHMKTWKKGLLENLGILNKVIIANSATASHLPF